MGMFDKFKPDEGAPTGGGMFDKFEDTQTAPKSAGLAPRDPFSYSKAETDRMRQEFAQKESVPTVWNKSSKGKTEIGSQRSAMGIASPQGMQGAEKARQWLDSPTEKPTDPIDFATRVVPHSAAKAVKAGIEAPYQMGKRIVDPIINATADYSFGNKPGLQAVGEGITGAVGGAIEDVKDVGKFFGTKAGIIAPDKQGNLNPTINPLTMAERAGNEALTDPVGTIFAAEGIRGVVKAIPPVVDAAKGGISSAIKAVTPSPNIDKLITEKYEKSVRPTVVGKRTFKQVESAANNVQQGVKKIVELKDTGLIQLGEDGAREARTPQTLKEFSDAISQAKEHVFNKYDGMMREANGNGATVDLNPLAGELSKIAADPVLNDIRPGAATYAKNLAESLTNRGAYTAEQAQQAVKSLNTSLDAFYKNPTYDTAVKAYTDSLVANYLRKNLDTAIEQASEPGYQALKKDYGALKSMEKEVNHRSIVDARKNVKGLLDFSDIFSGSQVIHGLVGLNPASIATGVGAHMIKGAFKRMNDPNVQIKNMFDRVDKHWDRGVEKPGFGAGVGTGIPEPPNDPPPKNPESYDPTVRTPGEATPQIEGNATPAQPSGYGEVELRPGFTAESPNLESVVGNDARLRQMDAGFPTGKKKPPANLKPGSAASKISSIQTGYTEGGMVKKPSRRKARKELMNES